MTVVQRVKRIGCIRGFGIRTTFVGLSSGDLPEDFFRVFPKSRLLRRDHHGGFPRGTWLLSELLEFRHFRRDSLFDLGLTRLSGVICDFLKKAPLLLVFDGRYKLIVESTFAIGINLFGFFQVHT